MDGTYGGKNFTPDFCFEKFHHYGERFISVTIIPEAFPKAVTYLCFFLKYSSINGSYNFPVLFSLNRPYVKVLFIILSYKFFQKPCSFLFGFVIFPKKIFCNIRITRPVFKTAGISSSLNLLKVSLSVSSKTVPLFFILLHLNIICVILYFNIKMLL